MGYITPEITGKLPGYLSPSAGLKFADVPNGLAAISKVPAAGWGQILAYMAFCEVSQDQSAGTPAAAGDFGFKVLTASDPEAKKTKLAAELANGRLAMMAIIGMFFQAVLEKFGNMVVLTCCMACMFVSAFLFVRILPVSDTQLAHACCNVFFCYHTIESNLTQRYIRLLEREERQHRVTVEEEAQLRFAISISRRQPRCHQTRVIMRCQPGSGPLNASGWFEQVQHVRTRVCIALRDVH